MRLLTSTFRVLDHLLELFQKLIAFPTLELVLLTAVQHGGALCIAFPTVLTSAHLRGRRRRLRPPMAPRLLDRHYRRLTGAVIRRCRRLLLIQVASLRQPRPVLHKLSLVPYLVDVHAELRALQPPLLS